MSASKENEDELGEEETSSVEDESGVCGATNTGSVVERRDTALDSITLGSVVTSGSFQSDRTENRRQATATDVRGCRRRRPRRNRKTSHREKAMERQERRRLLVPLRLSVIPLEVMR